ncbi:hypothetical protein B0H13DRAFT_2387884 [Mycena leptocephala]|nr:hypothetical protein B0H13DRAFT_2387884 [Mycena leptocephala]
MSALPACHAWACAKHLPNAVASTSGQTTTCSLSFGIDELMPLGDVNRPINSFVDRPSEDLRRIHRNVVPIEPPSPVKNARIAAVHGEASMNALMVESGIPDSFDDRYEMFNDMGDDPPVVQAADLPRARKAMFSDQTLYDWRDRSRDRYLLELLCLDGCIDASELVCLGSSILPTDAGSARAACYSVEIAACSGISITLCILSRASAAYGSTSLFGRSAGTWLPK